MSFMKKVIFSYLICLIVLLCVSCHKKDEFILESRSYNLINEDLIIRLSSNISDSVYMNIENINNVFLIDNITSEFMVVNIKEIFKSFENNMYIYEIIFDKKMYESQDIVTKDATIKIEYINGKTLDLDIGSLYLINTNESFDLKVTSLKAIVEGELVKSLKLSFKNTSSEFIKVLSIRLINGDFKTDLANLIDTNVFNCEISKGEQVDIILDLVCEKHTSTYETAIIIDYLLNEEIKHKVIKNFVLAKFASKKEAKKCVVY